MLIYLASPYSHQDEETRTRRFQEACKAAAMLMRTGATVFSPIAHSHSIVMESNVRTDADFWLNQDFLLLDKSDALVVLMLEGWKESAGVKAEVKRAEHQGIPILYMCQHGCSIEDNSCYNGVWHVEFLEDVPDEDSCVLYFDWTEKVQDYVNSNAHFEENPNAKPI